MVATLWGRCYLRQYVVQCCRQENWSFCWLRLSRRAMIVLSQLETYSQITAGVQYFIYLHYFTNGAVRLAMALLVVYIGILQRWPSISGCSKRDVTAFRATAVAARYLGLDSHLILSNSDRKVDHDPGLEGNLLVERMVGAHIHQVVESYHWGKHFNTTQAKHHQSLELLSVASQLSCNSNVLNMWLSRMKLIGIESHNRR